MKKLVMMAMVLGMGIAANAAVSQWALSTFQTPSGVDTDGNVTLGTDAISWSAGNFALYIISQQNGDGYAIGDLIAVDATGTIGADGKMAATTLFSQDDSVAMRDKYGDADGYLYMKMTGDYADANYDYTYDSGIVSKTLKNITGATNAKFTFYGSKSKWSATAVPEPTSGLLLLLGVAGMALRRRRA